ncbi:FliM/FliN family flagellar motor switch protein [Clostridium perfringens]
MSNVEAMPFEDLPMEEVKDFSGIKNINLLYDIPVCIKVKLGTTMLTVEEILKLDIDCIIPLNTNVGDPIEIYANDVLIGYGEIVIINDDIGVKVVQIKKDAINKLTK